MIQRGIRKKFHIGSIVIYNFESVKKYKKILKKITERNLNKIKVVGFQQFFGVLTVELIFSSW